MVCTQSRGGSHLYCTGTFFIATWTFRKGHLPMMCNCKHVEMCVSGGSYSLYVCCTWRTLRHILPFAKNVHDLDDVSFTMLFLLQELSICLEDKDSGAPLRGKCCFVLWNDFGVFYFTSDIYCSKEIKDDQFFHMTIVALSCISPDSFILKSKSRQINYNMKGAGAP